MSTFRLAGRSARTIDDLCSPERHIWPKSPWGEPVMHWTQAYDPLGHWWLSTLVAALPIIVLFGLLAGLRVKPHWCAAAGALTAIMVGIVVFRMPPILAA